MDDVVPGALQRLRAADIIRVAGLTVASLGQEYSRLGAVYPTKRQGAVLSGFVDTQSMPHDEAASLTNGAEKTERSQAEQHRYAVEVEILNANSWNVTCPCHRDPSSPCSHAAALLYQWLADPMSFVSSSSDSSLLPPFRGTEDAANPARAPGVPGSPALRRERLPSQARSAPLLRGPMPLGNMIDILGLLPLNELRGIAREYEVSTTGLNKQQLADAILEAFKRPEAVRRVVGTLEKTHRQLLAALTLAGGSMTDDDLRGLFERFSLGYANQLQGMLNILQKKGLLFRTNLHGPSSQRLSLNSSLLDVGLGWYVPAEVRAALHITLPITPFDMQAASAEDAPALVIKQAEPYALLADLLLVARTLDGYRLEYENEEDELSSALLSSDLFSAARAPSALAADGSASIPPPPGRPSQSLLDLVQHSVPRAPAFLHFAIRMLRLSDILYKDDTGTPYLHVLSNAAQLLLGPGRAEVARDLFSLWLAQPGYDELFDLQEHGLRLRCRATLMHHPALRPGELAAENSEARQVLLALLAQAPRDQWINFSSFARFIYRLSPTFLQRRQRLFPSPHWWLEQEEGRPLRPTQWNDWLRAEGRYLAQMLRGPLHWLGMSDVAFNQEGGLLAFRLTPMAGMFFNGLTGDEHLAEPVDSCPDPLLTVSEAGNILIACAPSAWPHIQLIEAFAEIAGVQHDRLCYRLVPRSLGEALGRGQQPIELVRLLRQEERDNPEADNPLTRVLAQLERLLASYGRVRLYSGVTLLEGADAMVMRELSAITSVDEQTVRAIYPTLLVLKKQGAEILTEDLKRRGQVPLLHDEEAYGAE